MAVCFFNNDYKNKYDCQFEIKEDGIEVIVNYNITKEIPEINGVRTFGENTNFDERDILIIDHQSKINYLMKNAYWIGNSMVAATPDCGFKTKFFSSEYFYDTNYENLCGISNNNCINKIRIYSNLINKLISFKSLKMESNAEEYIIRLKRDNIKQIIEINKNNIKKITISYDWSNVNKFKDYKLDIDLNGYVEIETETSINIEEIYDYVREISIYFQLFRPQQFNINKITVEIYNHYYGLNIPISKIKCNNLYRNSSVEIELVNFLSNCYKTIPYRNSRNEIRNIPYIILETSRSLEDNFLMFYRFIECYYKKQKIKDIKKKFIKYAIENNYKNNVNIKNKNIENLVQEIICLRNHYAHEGYYINNQKLYIAFPKINKKANPKNYRAENVDEKWIYEKTEILYEIAIDIIFNNMLNYNNYIFEKNF